MYLNDVEEGGETAFPQAGGPLLSEMVSFTLHCTSVLLKLYQTQNKIDNFSKDKNILISQLFMNKTTLSMTFFKPLPRTERRLCILG